MAGNTSPTLVEAFLGADPARPFLTFWRPASRSGDQTLTFGDFLTLAARFAAALAEHRVGPGDRVVLVMPPGPDVMAAFVGAMLLNAVPTILAYPNFKIDPAKYRHGLHGVVQNLSAQLVVVDPGFPSALQGELSVAAGGRVLTLSDAGAGDSVMDLNRVMLPHPSDIAFIQHSAGTTGLQKGVALSHRAVSSQLAHLASTLRIDDADRVISWLPLYHDMGLIASFVAPLALHLPLVMQSPTDWVLAPESMLELASTHRCTLCWLPNFAFQFIARRTSPEVKARLDLASLRAVINCSEPVRAPSVDEFYEAFRACGLRADAVHASYAMAENTFAVTHTDAGRTPPARLVVDREMLGHEHRAVIVGTGAPSAIALVSSGRCLTGNEIRVVNDSGADLDDLHVGELLVRSDSMLTGYVNRPDLTAQVLVDGWYRTSDLGFSHKREIYVLGRKDDTIIIAGRNVWPADVEEIASRHPAVHDGRVVAFGVLSAALGTQDLVVVAEVHADAPLADADGVEGEIRTLIAKELDLAARVVRLVEPHWIVKSSAGKAARAATRSKFLRDFGQSLGIEPDILP